MTRDELVKIVGLPELLDLVPLSRTQIWRLEKQGAFPTRIRIGQRRIGWRADELQDWLEQRTRADSHDDGHSLTSEEEGDAE
ncbi:helix-turn-helix transcriptional regulator [Roseibium album]|uniref:helix-turn-helix transcriptional regulator n=1 Tax=Roseibium album TaxID=311410 RepID=UPI002492D668|nr:AlpA family phage regulatory protein [Roseibium album]